MNVDEIDARTAPDDVLLAFYRVAQACGPEFDSGWSDADAIAFYRFQPVTHTSCLWLADAGFASLNVHGPAAAFARVLVHPDRRRNGLGSALLDRVVERCRELGVTAVHGEHATAAGAAFAARHGARDSNRVVASQLDLASAHLAEPEPPDGWQLVTWLRRIPDEHLDAFVVARLGMDDAPAPAAMDIPPMTADKVRASEASLEQRNREMRVTVALHESGEIGAFTELRVSHGAISAFTDDTATVAAHRGRGLGRAVKLESLRRLREDHPEVEYVTTSNDEGNAAMRHINESVGFVPTVTWTTSTLTL